jgi:hypothetical protein
MGQARRKKEKRQMANNNTGMLFESKIGAGASALSCDRFG